VLPSVNLRPPFNITRASHIRLGVADLAASREFYTQIVGLVVTAETDNVCYLRALGEMCHHSLVLEQQSDGTTCRRLGLRVMFDEDLDLAYDHFVALGLPATWAKEEHQGRTLHVSDPIGTPLELCSVMDTEPRLYMAFEQFTGGHAQQLDHFQILAPNPRAVCEFYGTLGFRNSEYIAAGEDIIAGFMYRKSTCLDFAVAKGDGPRMHHFAYLVPETHDVFMACDLAGNLGYGAAVERGPGRHGPGGMLFVYLRDPDGHRVELFLNHYVAVDLETEPVRWDATSLSTNARWGLPGPARWYFEATAFPGVTIEAAGGQAPMTLERYLLEADDKRS
jgi:catechol 2,3-dioxygenase